MAVRLIGVDDANPMLPIGVVEATEASEAEAIAGSSTSKVMTSRRVKDALPAFDPRTYLAAGDGVTDDQAAFAALIAAAPAGSVIDLAGKTYYVGGAVDLTKTLTVQNGALLAGQTSVLTVNAPDCTLQNLDISRAVTPTGDASIAAGAAVGVRGVRTRILNSRFTDATSYCILFHNGLADYSLVQGCDFTNSAERQSSGFISAADGASPNVGIVVRDCTGIGTGCSLGFMFLDSSGTLISGCKLEGFRRLPTLTMTGWTLVTGNIYKTTDRTDGHTRVLYNNGVLVAEESATPTTPGSNEWGFSGTDLYINLGGTDPNTRTITSDIVSGYGITVYTDSGFALNGNNITDCDITDTDGFGIYLQIAYNDSLDNTIDNCRLTDVCLEGSQLGSLPFAGIGVTGGDNTVISNTVIRSPGGVGFKAIPGGLSTTSKGRMIGCSILDATGFGVETLAGTCEWTFVDTHALRCATGFRHGSTTSSDTALIKLIGCSAKGSTANHGFSCAPVAGTDFRVTLDGCDFADNAARGATFSVAASVLVTGCKFRNNVTNGLVIQNTAAATVLNNHFEHTTAGILQISASLSVTQLALIGNVITNGGTISAVATTFFASGNSPAVTTVNAQTGTTYAPTSADPYTTVTLNNAAGITVTLPSNATTPIPVGKSGAIEFTQIGAGQVTFTNGSGATVNSANGLKARAQYSRVLAMKTSTNGWVLSGDTAV